MKNILLTCFTALLLLQGSISSAQVLINEVSASNRSNMADDFGEFEDWVELYNAGAATVDISNYFLSDNPANPTKWQIPAGTSITPGQHRLFFCSGRDLDNGLAMHTNFKLTQGNGETVLFSDNGGALLDQIVLQPTLVNHSRGRFPDGGAWRVYTTPTAGTANGAVAYTDYAETPQMNLAAGFYGGPQAVTITTTDNGATIRYTLNGAEPTAASPAYTGPIAVNTSTVIRAKSFPPAGSPLTASFTESNSYLININHTMPVVSLISDQYDELFAGGGWGEITSAIEYFTEDGVQRFEAYGEADPHGNDSWAYDQKGVDFVVRDQYGYGDEVDYQIFPTKPRQEFQRFMFKAGASDNYPFNNWGPGGSCHLRDAFVQSLAERANLNVDFRTNDHCVVYINGEYWGLYEIREKVNDPDFTDYYYNQEEEDLDFLSYWGGLNVRYGSPDDWNDLYAYIMANDLSQPANYNAVDARLDIASVIDYMILNTWSVNSDWINWNTMWWRGRGTPAVKWKYVLWDMDNTFNLGQNFSGWETTDFNADPCDLEDNPGFVNAGPNEGHLDMFRKLMDNPDFKQRFINRYSELTNTYLSCDYALTHLDSIVNHITPEMPGQIARWGGSMADWEGNLDYIRGQITGRCQFLEETGIEDCYEVNGPWDLAFNVSPAGSGTIQFNELTIPTYPWSGSYFGGVEGDLNATPATSAYEFWYWEVFYSDLNSDSTVALNSFMIEAADSIVAHFRLIETHEIVFLVDPPNSGNISINGITPGSYPYAQIYNADFNIFMTATPATNFDFINFTTVGHTLTPDPNQPSNSFLVDVPDTIIAHFKPFQTWFLTVKTEPQLAGKVMINGDWVDIYPTTTEYFEGEAITTDAFPFEKYLFSHYTLNYGTLDFDSSLTVNGFTLDTTDTLTAHFLLKEVIPQTMYVPSGFTPNGDGINDVFKPYHTETVVNGNVRIFNRWGEEVFVSEKLDFEWDGTKNGKIMPDDVYYFVLNYYLDSDYFETVQGRISISR